MARRRGIWGFWVFVAFAVSYILYQIGGAFGLWPSAPMTHDPAGYPVPHYPPESVR